MTKKNVSRAIFNAVVIGIAGIETPLIALTVPLVWAVKRRKAFKSAPRGVPLTHAEDAVVKSIFGKEVSTRNLKKYLMPDNHPEDLAAEGFGRKRLLFYGPKNHSADYTKDPENYITFVHEMTHIWQHQHTMRDVFNAIMRRVHNPAGQPDNKYKYELSPQSRFKDFDREQQASIIGDYAGWILFPGVYRYKFKYPPAHDWNSLQNVVLLQKVVEEKFPEARKTRLALEAQEKDEYAYNLSPQSRFDDFSTAQQAAIMVHYRHLLDDDLPDLTPENDALLCKAVEEKIPAIRDVRLAQEAQRKTASAPAASSVYKR